MPTATKQHRTWDPDDCTIRVSRICSVTKKPYVVTVSDVAWKAWHTGTMAQDAFPGLTPEQREFLISNTTPAEWDELFAPEPLASEPHP